MSRLPVFNRDFADPFVLREGSTYYAYSTNWWLLSMPLLTSTNLTTWTDAGDALGDIFNSNPTQANNWVEWGATWAPSVLKRGSAYLAYNTVREPRFNRQAITISRSSSPGGPFTNNPQLLFPTIYQLRRGGTIDAEPFVDTDGTAYLLFKSDDNAVGGQSTCWIQRLSDDGLRLVGRRVAVVRQDRPWETFTVEAPSLVHIGDTYFLFYSAGCYNDATYCIGYATSKSVFGPYTKVTVNGPWFASDAQVAGPGGQAFFQDTTGNWKMCYHGWTPGAVGYNGPANMRSLRIASISFTSGVPVAS